MVVVEVEFTDEEAERLRELAEQKEVSADEIIRDVVAELLGRSADSVRSTGPNGC